MPVEEVRYCSACRCKTWHVNEHCEWEDGHKLAHDAQGKPWDTKESWDRFWNQPTK